MFLYRNPDLLLFNLCRIGLDGFCSDRTHQQCDILQIIPQMWWGSLAAEISWHRSGGCFTRSDVELGAMHRTGYYGADECSLLQRRVRVTAASCHSIELPVAIADHKLVTFNFYELHTTGSNLGGIQCESKIIFHF